MSQKLTSQRDIDFVLYELLKVESLLKSDIYSEFNKKMFDMVIKEAKNLATREIFPTYTECDEVGAKFENGKVTVPECLRRPYELLVEGEWGALTESAEFGGQGLPSTIAQAAMEYLITANYVLVIYPMLAHGAGKMIDLYGTPEQKKLFLENLYTGTWGGTMMLTEPQAGSDVGALTTTAKKNDDGTWSISGNKIFITNGDHDITENIIHPVLARIEGDPEGTKGISIFIVPKIWVNEDGTLGEPNDVVVTGIEKKMGLHGSPTCSVSLGSKGKCRGLLLGSPRQGMEIMFHMMNEVRLEVGTQAFGSASLAYQLALDYAKERRQGSSLLKKGGGQVTIIEHPDVRRMLLRMKSYVEGLRALVYYIAYCFDRTRTAGENEEKQCYSNLVEILTPVVKAYSSEKGFDICVEAMQIFGGYGYTREYPAEQIVRDCKIASIYEGSNGIQAMDFLGRKVGGRKGAMLDTLVSEIRKAVEMAKASDGLGGLANQLDDAVRLFEKTAKDTTRAMFTDQVASAVTCAHPLMDICGDITMSWLLLWSAVIAEKKLEKTSKKDAAFYSGKIRSARFFIQTILPVTMGKLNGIIYENHPAADMEAELF